MNAPIVSAIIITHNRLPLLKRAIDSVKVQTYKNIELIVVDDASGDGTKEFCELQDFKYLHIDKSESKGGNHARNIGIQSANGEYIAFLDDDDYWLPTKIEKQVALALSTGVGVIHCHRRVEFVEKNGDVRFYDDLKSDDFKGNLSRRILYQITIITSALLVKKSLIKQIGMFDENLGFWQEYEMSIRLAQVSNIDFIDEPLYVYRINFSDPHRLTNKYYAWQKAVRYIHSKHLSLFAQLSFKERLKVKKLIVTDAISRAYAAGLQFEWYKNRIILKLLQCLGV
jgi:glycosyltransferase involved in cell wall biosynthesis